MGWFDGKGVCLQSKGSRDQTSWVVLCVVDSGMLMNILIEFL